MAVDQRWSKRELERQFRVAAFERAVLDPPKLSPAVTRIHGDAAAGVFKDAYAVEFLDLPAGRDDTDPHLCAERARGRAGRGQVRQAADAGRAGQPLT